MTLCPLRAQDIPYFHYTVKDGLPSNVLYEVMHDRQGMLWVASESGVARFDGRRFITYSTADGLTDDEVFKVQEDRQGILWMMTFNGRLCGIRNGKVIIPPLQPPVPVRQAAILRMVEYPNGEIWLLVNEALVRYHDGAFSVVSAVPPLGGWIGDGEQGPLFLNHARDEVEIYQRDTSILIPIRNLLRLHPKFRKSGDFKTLPSMQGFAQERGNLVRLAGDSLSYTWLNPDTNWTEVLNDGRMNADGSIWIWGTKGIRLLKPGPDGYKQVLHLLPDIQFTRITEDFEGGIWAASYGHGLYYFPSIYHGLKTQIQIPEFHAASLCRSTDGNIWAGGIEGRVLRIDSTGRIQYLPPYMDLHRRVYTLLPLADGSVLTGNSRVLQIRPDFSIREFTASPGYLKFLLRTTDSTVWSGGSHCLVRYAGLNMNLTDTILRYRCHGGVEDGRNGLWVGSEMGLVHTDGKHTTGPLGPWKGLRVTSVTRTGDSIWAVTANLGILLKTGESYRMIGRQQGLAGTVRMLTAAPDGSIWAATTVGVAHITPHPDGRMQIEYITRIHGLQSDDIRTVLVTPNMLWVGSAEGILGLPMENLRIRQPHPRIYFEGLSQHDSLLGTDTVFSLKWPVEDLKFGFSSVSFMDLGKRQIEYRLSPLMDRFEAMEGDAAVFRSLEAGDYVLEVRACQPDGFCDPVAYRIQLHIQNPFWRIPWVRLMAVLLLMAIAAGLVAWLFIRRNRAHRQETARKRENLEWQLAALRSRMNPHFLFNALQSIQQFITSNDKLAAHRYLSSFAGLMRLILDHSGRNQVTLEEELEVLRKYLELENLRLGDKFDLVVELSPNLNPAQVLVPPLLLQPLSENAVWHGISPLPGRGRILLRIEKQEQCLRYTLEDNGTGRPEAVRGSQAESPAGKRNPFGINGVKERILAYAQMHNSSASFTLTDLQSSSGAPAGTRIEITFPYLTDV